MEGNYIWNQWCEKRNLPRTYSDLQELYPEADTELLDKVWDSQLQKFEHEDVDKGMSSTFSGINTLGSFINSICMAVYNKGILVMIYNDKTFDKYLVKVNYQDGREAMVDISEVNVIEKHRIIAAILCDNFKGIEGIKVYRREGNE